MSTAKDLLVIDVSEVSYCPDPNDPHSPPRDVRDPIEVTLPRISVSGRPIPPVDAAAPLPIAEAFRLGMHVAPEPIHAPARSAIVPTFIGHCPGSPCAVCGRIDLPGGATAQPDTRPLCGAHFATWERQRAEIETDRAARDRPPVRDIREAMHPAITPPGEALWTPRVPVEQVVTRDIRRGFIPIADVPPDILADIDCPESPAGAHVHVDTPHVATLPDGARVNLPAGTTLREGEVPRSSLPPINLNDALLELAYGDHSVEDRREALMHFARCWHQNSGEIIARDLLRRAQPWIAPGVPDIVNAATEAQPAATIGQLRAEIVAFLAGKAPPTAETRDDLSAFIATLPGAVPVRR